jgi:hypothetical protein
VQREVLQPPRVPECSGAAQQAPHHLQSTSNQRVGGGGGCPRRCPGGGVGGGAGRQGPLEPHSRERLQSSPLTARATRLWRKARAGAKLWPCRCARRCPARRQASRAARRGPAAAAAMARRRSAPPGGRCQLRSSRASWMPQTPGGGPCGSRCPPSSGRWSRGGAVRGAPAAPAPAGWACIC